MVIAVSGARLSGIGRSLIRLISAGYCSTSTQVEIGSNQFGTRRPRTKAKTTAASGPGPSSNANSKSRNSISSRCVTMASTSMSKVNNGSQEKPDTNDNIIWIDCEMTGLDLDKDLIMEVACIITGPDLKEIARHSSIAIHIPDELLKSMDAWCVVHHRDSGLTEDCRSSRVSTEEAELAMLEFVEKHTKPGVCPVGGNSVYMDRMFLQKYMPALYKHFHYRSIDVSTVKELVRRWYVQDYQSAPRKRFVHRTIEDIEDTIRELQYYRSSTFKQQQQDLDLA